MIVLDTNVVSELFRREPDPSVVRWVRSLDNEVAITAITMAELLAGVHRLPEGKRKNGLQKAVNEAIAPYLETGLVFAFDETCAASYAMILTRRERAGLPIATADAQIAAICLAKGAICATRNTADFAGAGVDLVNPWH